MRRQIVHEGADQLTYEIRGIVAIAKEVSACGVEVFWENIGDPIQKGEKIPEWMKEELTKLLLMDSGYGYSPTKGMDETREFLASKVNERGKTQITKEDIIFFNGLGDAVAYAHAHHPPRCGAGLLLIGDTDRVASAGATGQQQRGQNDCRGPVRAIPAQSSSARSRSCS